LISASATLRPVRREPGQPQQDVLDGLDVAAGAAAESGEQLRGARARDKIGGVAVGSVVI
jgi:hypothetical protein